MWRATDALSPVSRSLDFSENDAFMEKLKIS